MYNKLNKELKGSRKNIADVCAQFNIPVEDIDFAKLGLDTCTHCGMWSNRLIPDLDGNLICLYCADFIGL